MTRSIYLETSVNQYSHHRQDLSLKCFKFNYCACIALDGVSGADMGSYTFCVC